MRRHRRHFTFLARSVYAYDDDLPECGAGPTLLLALDLGNTLWKLACRVSPAGPPRIRTQPARDLTALVAELTAARERFGLAPDEPVVSC